MDPNNTHGVIFWDNLYKLRPWLTEMLKSFETCQSFSVKSNKFVSLNNKKVKFCARGSDPCFFEDACRNDTARGHDIALFSVISSQK